MCEQVVWEEAAAGGRRSERGSAQPKALLCEDFSV